MARKLFFYIFREILTPFMLGLLTLTFFVLIFRFLRLIDLVVNRGASFADMIWLFGYLLPPFLSLTLPMALLLSLLLAFGRLSSDNEIYALKACGVSLYHIAIPVLFFTTLVFIGNIWITVYGVSWGRQGLKQLAYTMSSQLTVSFKERVFNDDFPGLVLFAESVPVKGEKLQGILISDQRNQDEPINIFAREGHILSDPDSLTLILHLVDGSIHHVSDDLQVYEQTAFKTEDIVLDLAQTLGGGRKYRKKVKDMSIWELAERIRARRKANEDTNEEQVILHQKFTIPIACFIFAFIAMPLGIQSRTASKSVGIAVALVVVLIYYILHSVGEAVGNTGGIPPPVAMWAPNLIMGCIALYFFMKRAKESPVPLFEWIDRLVQALRKIRQAENNP